MSNSMKRALLIWAVVLTAGAAGAQQPATPYDVVILGGTVVDGTGSVRFRADVAIRGDRIVRVDRDGLVAASAREVVRADGLIVAPGFVNQHAHIQTSIHAHPLAENSTRHIHHVIVNGVPIIRSGALTGATPGRVLQGPARAASRQSQETPRMTATSPELEQRDQPATADDLRILTKAADLLKDESVWNRADDRQCEDDEKTGKRSLFCALQRACIDVLGRVRSPTSRAAGGSIRRRGCHARQRFRASSPRLQQPPYNPVGGYQSGPSGRNGACEVAPEGPVAFGVVRWWLGYPARECRARRVRRVRA